MNWMDSSYPSLVPDGETKVEDNAAFLAACSSKASSFATAHGWYLGGSVLTHSDKWGLVYRIDYRIKGQTPNSSVVNRFICWATPGGEILGMAFLCGQNIEAL